LDSGMLMIGFTSMLGGWTVTGGVFTVTGGELTVMGGMVAGSLLNLNAAMMAAVARRSAVPASPIVMIELRRCILAHWVWSRESSISMGWMFKVRVAVGWSSMMLLSLVMGLFLPLAEGCC